LDGTESHEFEQEDLDAAAGASGAVKAYCANAVSEAQRLGWCVLAVSAAEHHVPAHVPAAGPEWAATLVNVARAELRRADQQ
jgi:hypothetical protein